MKLVKEALVSQMPKLQCTPIITDGSETEVKKKYDWWCHTHGVNLTHGHKLDGSKYEPCTSPGPNYNAEATINNPLGGNTKRDDKAGKYWIGIPGRRGARVSNS